MSLLTRENYKKGFLIDEDLMAGVSDDPDSPGGCLAFVIRHATGEYLGSRSFDQLESALEAINSIPRKWKIESTSGCDGSRCAEGKCKKEGCKIYAGTPSETATTACEPNHRPEVQRNPDIA